MGYATSLSPRLIAHPNEADVPSPSSGGWIDSTIRGNARKHDRLLLNEVHVGILVFGRNLLNGTDSPASACSARQARRISSVRKGRSCRSWAMRVGTLFRSARKDRCRVSFDGTQRPRLAPAALPARADDHPGSLRRRIKDQRQGKGRFGCHSNKRQDPEACGNCKTSARRKLKSYVLARLKAGQTQPPDRAFPD